MLEVAVQSEPWFELWLEGKADVASVPERIYTLRQAHLHEGSFSPTASILSQLAMGKRLHNIYHSTSKYPLELG